MKCEPECVIDINNTNLIVDFALMLGIMSIVIDRDGVDDANVNEGDASVNMNSANPNLENRNINIGYGSLGANIGKSTNPEEERQKRLAFFSRHSPVSTEQTHNTPSLSNSSCLPTARPYLNWKME